MKAILVTFVLASLLLGGLTFVPSTAQADGGSYMVQECLWGRISLQIFDNGSYEVYVVFREGATPPDVLKPLVEPGKHSQLYHVAWTGEVGDLIAFGPYKGPRPDVILGTAKAFFAKVDCAPETTDGRPILYGFGFAKF